MLTLLIYKLGQAIRIAQFEGLHTRLPEEQLGAETVVRCRNLWWTLYIMDRHFSYSVGLPMTTQDDDIGTLIDPPSSCSDRDVTLSLQAKLSHLLSFILTSKFRSSFQYSAMYLTLFSFKPCIKQSKPSSVHFWIPHDSSFRH